MRQTRRVFRPLVLLATLASVPGCEGESDDDGACGGGIAATVLAVTDGDTIKTDGPEKVRFLGVEAPETHQTRPTECPAEWEDMDPADQAQYLEACCYGGQAKQMLQWLLPVGTTVCLVNPEGGDLEIDYFKRSLADVYVGGTYVNGKLAAGGYVRVYPEGHEYRHPTMGAELDALQAAASAADAGLWGYCYQQSTMCIGE
jgi:endonuclease YncB( thermonuclease family)